MFIGMALLYTVVLSLYAWDHYQNNASAMVLDYDYKQFEITKPAVTMCLYEPVAQNKFPEVFKRYILTFSLNSLVGSTHGRVHTELIRPCIYDHGPRE